jgi:hypothetical protein
VWCETVLLKDFLFIAFEKFGQKQMAHILAVPTAGDRYAIFSYELLGSFREREISEQKEEAAKDQEVQPHGLSPRMQIL